MNGTAVSGELLLHNARRNDADVLPKLLWRPWRCTTPTSSLSCPKLSPLSPSKEWSATLAPLTRTLPLPSLLGLLLKLAPPSFIHDVTRPHPGQIQAARNIRTILEGSKFAVHHEEEVGVKEDEGVLRQDRYPLRTAAQVRSLFSSSLCEPR